jgi:hypothetical protein
MLEGGSWSHLEREKGRGADVDAPCGVETLAGR